MTCPSFCPHPHTIHKFTAEEVSLQNNIALLCSITGIVIFSSMVINYYLPIFGLEPSEW